MSGKRTTPTTAMPRPRCPSGLKASVLVGMSSDERALLEQIANQEMRSLSATARMLIMRGIRQYEAESQSEGS